MDKLLLYVKIASTKNFRNFPFEFFSLWWAGLHGWGGCIGEVITEFQIQGLFLSGSTHSRNAIRVKDSY